MKRIIVTNNKKVSDKFANEAEIQMLESASCHEVYLEGKKIAEKGGKLLLDPTRGNVKSYYKSLVFALEKNDNNPSEKSLSLLDICIAETVGIDAIKEPILSGIFQSKEIDPIKSILG